MPTSADLETDRGSKEPGNQNDLLQEASPDGHWVELPRFLQIEPVGQCNLRCQMCPIQFRRDGPPYGPVAFMPLEHFIRIVDQFPDLAELHLQGLGEPMMHPRLFDMFELGNVLESGVEAVWNGPKHLAFRRQLDSDTPPEICRTCSVYHGTF